MRNVNKVLAVLLVAVAVAPAVNAEPPSNTRGSGITPVANGTPAGAPFSSAPGYVAPYPYYGPYPGPYYGPGYWGSRGNAGGSGHVSVSFDFDGLLNGWAPWRGWWW